MSEVVNPSSDDGGGESPREKLLTAGLATGLGWGAIALTFALLPPVIFVVRQFGLPFPTSPLALTALELVVGQLFVMGGLSVAYLLYTGRGLDYVPIRRPTLVESLVVLVAPFGVIFVSAAVTQLSLLFGVEPSQHALTGMTDVDPRFYIYMIPLVIFIVGPFEELLYRGVVQGRLRESFGPWPAILLASLIFATIHLPAHGFGQAGLASTAASMAALVGGSVVFGWLYEWSRNLTVVALVHGLYNSILLVLLYVVAVYGPEIEEMAEMSEPALALVGL